MPLLDNRTLDRRDASRGRPWRTQVPTLPEALRRRAALLEDDERLLVELAAAQALSRRQIGLLLHCPAGTVSRRLQRILARLMDPIVTALTDDDCTLREQYRKIGIDHFLRRRSLKQLARQHNLTIGQVEATLAFIRGWHRGSTGRG